MSRFRYGSLSVTTRKRRQADTVSPSIMIRILTIRPALVRKTTVIGIIPTQGRDFTGQSSTVRPDL